MEPWVSPILMIVIFIFAAVVFFVYNLESDKDRIGHYFAHRNCRIVSLNFSGFGGKHHHIYDIVFVEPDYKVYRIQCQTGRFGRLWWSDKIYLRAIQPEQLEDYLASLEPQVVAETLDTRSPKERLADSLNSHYRFERKHALQQVRQSEEVDAAIVQMIHTMADYDEDKSVREEAANTLQWLQTK